MGSDVPPNLAPWVFSSHSKKTLVPSAVDDVEDVPKHMMLSLLLFRLAKPIRLFVALVIVIAAMRLLMLVDDIPFAWIGK